MSNDKINIGTTIKHKEMVKGTPCNKTNTCKNYIQYQQHDNDEIDFGSFDGISDNNHTMIQIYSTLPLV